jgi:hypothetical protein
MALAFVLVFGVGLFAKSFLRLMNVDPGFEAKHVLTLETYVYSTRYKTPDAELGYYRQALQQLKTNPEIESAAMTSMLPFADFDTTGLQIREQPLANAAQAATVDRYSVSPDYFRVMRIPLKRGRAFTDHDRKGAQAVAIISEGCAQLQFAGQNPLGQHIQLGGGMKMGRGRRLWASWATCGSMGWTALRIWRRIFRRHKIQTSAIRWWQGPLGIRGSWKMRPGMHS